jgi:predicted aspartyl protease
MGEGPCESSRSLVVRKADNEHGFFVRHVSRGSRKMICPKCGFDQPDDIYCVYCGVNIEKYVNQKKRRHRGGVLSALIVIAAVSVAAYLVWTRQAETPDRTGEEGYEGGLAQRGKETAPGSRSRELSVDLGRDQRKASSESENRSRRERNKADEPGNQYGRDNETPVRSSTARDEGRPLSDGKAEETAGTAQQWLEKGRALDDDSDTEVQCYKKAIELDPHFAPAYYRLGAIYYRQANYELADEQFAKFVEYASEADREAYDIYVYYSLADVERLTKEEEEEETAPHEGGEEAPLETESGSEGETDKTSKDNAGHETGDEVMTIVKFSPLDGHVLVPVVLNDSLQATVMVDTGAGITILSKELVRDLGLAEQTTHPITLKTIAKDVQGQLVTLDSIQIGGLRKDHFPVAIADLSLVDKGQFHGILGMDFMKNYIIRIDNETQSMTLAPKAP